MKVLINNVQKTFTTFENIPFGDVFEFNNAPYIKLAPVMSCNYNALAFLGTILVRFDTADRVVRLIQTEHASYEYA